MAGYAFAMFDFPGKRVLFYVLLCGLMVPFTVVIVPVVQILATFHWLNTYQGLIVPNIAFALGTFLFRQFFFGAPPELGEAARIDGASEWRIFYKIYSPLARPVIAALGIIAFLTNWNNFLFPLIVVNTTNMNVVSTGPLRLPDPVQHQLRPHHVGRSDRDRAHPARGHRWRSARSSRASRSGRSSEGHQRPVTGRPR